MHETAWLYTDGGSRGNPGKGAIGITIVANNPQRDILYVFARKLKGKPTNNEAEYVALITGLRMVKANFPTVKKVICRTDSKLIAKQMNNEWKIKSESLKRLKNLAVSERHNLEFEIKQVGRGDSWIALCDRNLNARLDGRGIKRRLPSAPNF